MTRKTPRLPRGSLRLLCVALALSASCSSGCATTGYRCLPLAEYDDVFSMGLALELERLDDNSRIMRAMSDYLILRDMARAACH